MELVIDNYDDIVFEWIPYDQFYSIIEINKGDSIIVYSAKWEDGPLEYNAYTKKYERYSNGKKITLKCFHNTQNINEFLNKVWNFLKILS